MHKGRRSAYGLHYVGFQSVLQQNCHCVFRFEVTCKHRLSSIGVGNKYVSQAAFQIGDVFRQRKHSHNFTGGSYVELFPSFYGVFHTAVDDNATQSTVVDVQSAIKNNVVGVDVERISLKNAVVYHGAQQIVCCSYCMKISREVQIYVFHWQNLRISATCSAPFDSENGTQRRLSQCQTCVCAHKIQTVCQSYGNSCFSFSCRGRIYCRNQNQFGVFFRRRFCRNFCFVVSVQFQLSFFDAYFCSNICYFFQFAFSCNFNIRHAFSSCAN